KKINTKDLYFHPSLTKNGGKTILTMRADIAPGKYLEYIYTLTDNYMVGFNVHSKGLKTVINQAGTVQLDWKMKGYSRDKSKRFENRYTEIMWYFDGAKDDSQRAD